MTRLDFLCDITEPLVQKALALKYTVHYEGTLPPGPAIIFAKHQHDFDQFFIGTMLRRQQQAYATYPMREFKFPLNYLFRPYGGKLVVRSQDVVSGNYTKEEAEAINGRTIAYVLSRLRLGEHIVIFPEGTRAYKRLRTPFKMGITEKILEAQEIFSQALTFSALGIEYEGKNIWLRAGTPFSAQTTSEIERKLQEELPRLSNIQP